MVVSPREFIVVIAASIVLSLAILAGIWPRLRDGRTLAVIAVAATIGIILWNLALNVTNASFLNVDSPLVGLSVQDVGSGVAAFVATLVALQFVVDGSQSAARVLGISAVVGIATVLVDLFA